MISSAYAAGFFDGEGCVNITVMGKTRQVSLRLMLSNTDAEILSLFRLQFGGFLSKPRTLKEGWKPYRQWVITGLGALEFMKFIRKNIIVKRAQVELAIEFMKFMHLPIRERCTVHSGPIDRSQKTPIISRKPETIATELSFKDRMHILNKKGVA